MTEHCESCRVGMPLLSDDEVAAQLEDLSEWTYDASEKRIQKVFQFKGYYKAMAFVNAVAWIAHQEKHHPDMQVGYNQVIVQYQTHEAGGVTKNDMICAKQVEALMACP